MYSNIPAKHLWAFLSQNKTKRISRQTNGNGEIGHAKVPPWQYHCTQKAGDVLFVPEFVSHAVLNLAPFNAGYARELTGSQIGPTLSHVKTGACLVGEHFR